MSHTTLHVNVVGSGMTPRLMLGSKLTTRPLYRDDFLDLLVRFMFLFKVKTTYDRNGIPLNAFFLLSACVIYTERVLG